METDCPAFSTCSAPICPIAISGGECWYANEAVCRKRGIQAEHKVLKVQKKLAKYTKQNGDIGYFDMAMLSKMRRITHKTVGCDPDRPGRKVKNG